MQPKETALSEPERKVLDYLVQHEEYGFCFATIASDTGLDKKAVRVACRSLAARGLAKFHRTLWKEYESEPAGAGYSATFEGVKFSKLPEIH